MTPSIAARLAVFLTASALCVRVAGTEARGHVIVSKVRIDSFTVVAREVLELPCDTLDHHTSPSPQQISAPVTSDLIVQGSPFYVTYTVINLGAECVVPVLCCQSPPSNSRMLVESLTPPTFPPGPRTQSRLTTCFLLRALKCVKAQRRTRKRSLRQAQM